MNKSVLYFSVFLLAACSGRSGGHENSGTQEAKSVRGNVVWQTGSVIDLDKDSRPSIFEFVDSIQVVQLETDMRCLLGTFYNVLFYKNLYYIFDREQQTILCFGQNGKFVRKVSDRGRGPQEYEYLGNIAIDPYNEQLLLVVPFGSVLCFDLEGNFISKITVPDAGAVNEVHVLDADRWLITSLNIYQMLYFSKKEGQIVERLYERGARTFRIIPLFRSYTYNDSIYFSPLLGSETLNMKDRNRRVAFSWDFGANNNKQGRVESLINELEDLDNRQYPSGQAKAYESERLINSYLNHNLLFTREWSRYRMATLDYKSDQIDVLYDKQEHKTAVFRETIEGVRWDTPYFMYNQDMIIVPVYDVNETTWKSNTKELFSPKQLKIVEAHKPETDNPFLVIYHLKKQ